MKRVSIFLSAVLAAALSLSLWTAPAAEAASLSAVETQSLPSTVEITYLSDGSYLVTELVAADNAVMSTNTVSGSKKTTAYNSSGSALWSFTVSGTFRYTGSSATATSAYCSYIIYSSLWSLKTASAYCSGSQAIADGTFKGALVLTKNVTVTLTCSATGVLS